MNVIISYFFLRSTILRYWFFLRTSSITFAGIPFLERGCPPEERPSPPLGDRQGSATGLVLGLLPNHLVLPAARYNQLVV
jgi:hypothetical protein